MTETSSKGVLRSTTIMFLFVGLFGIWMGGCEIYQGLKVKRLIKELQDEDADVRCNVVFALGQMRSGYAVPALIQLLQDENEDVRWNAVYALGQLGFGRDHAHTIIF